VGHGPVSGRNTQPGYLLRAPAEELDAWRDAAAERGQTLSEWLREAARRRVVADAEDARYAAASMRVFGELTYGARRREPPIKPKRKPRKTKRPR
jgi:hypothetical protein